RMIDARLHGERDRVVPRVFARPLELRRGEGLSQKELLDRLNDLGYAQRPQVQAPGEFALNPGLVTVVPRAGTHTGRRVVISFVRPVAARRPGRAQPGVTLSTRIEAISLAEGPKNDTPLSRVTLDAPMLTALIYGGRET